VWGVNVQPYSGSPANFAVYTALLRPHDRIMGLDLPSGGHLTHGFYTAKKKVSATSIFFESLPYKIDAEGIIDYAGLEKYANDFRPQLIIIGGSAYPRDYDYERVRRLCDGLGAIMMMDMAHSAGLISAGCLKSPFDLCDIVTTTTHKSLRGPRSGMIFYRKKKLSGEATDFELRICQAVFPGLQGGPHMHQIAAIATQMREVATPEFKEYARQVQTNCRVLAEELVSRGHSLASGGTDNHLVLWNLRPHGITGARVDKTLEAVSITANKNAIVGDKSALNPGGIRLGTCALTSRGLKEADIKQVAGFLHEALELALSVHAPLATAPLAEFVAAIKKNAAVAELRGRVEAFAASFPMPGFDVSALKYKDGMPQH
jgi:glycine hydroxymethyltransferase